MNARTLAILALILAVLAGAYFILPAFGPRDRGIDGGPKNGEKAFPGFELSKAFRIELEKDGKRVELEFDKSAEVWRIANDRNRIAKGERVAALALAVEASKIEEPRPGDLEIFGLEKTSRAEVKFLSDRGETLAAFSLGNRGEKMDSCFALLPRYPNTVVKLNQDLVNACNLRTVEERKVLNSEAWYDLAVLEFSADGVIEFAIKKGHQTVRVQKVVPGKGPLQPRTPADLKEKGMSEEERQGWTWWITEPESGKADRHACTEVYNSAARLYAKAYADETDPAVTGLDQPFAKVRFVLLDGSEHTIHLGKRFEDYSIAQVKGRPEVWKIENFVHEKLSKSLDELRERSPENARPVTEPQPHVPEHEVKPREVIPPAPATPAPERPASKAPIRIRE